MSLLLFFIKKMSCFAIYEKYFSHFSGVNGETIRLLSHQMEASLMDYFDTVVALKLEAKLAKSEADKLSFEAIRNPTLS